MISQNGTSAPRFPLSPELLAETGSIAFSAAIQTITGTNFTAGEAYALMPDGTLENAELLAAPLIAHVAAGHLLTSGKHARVVAGAAVWSVGPKALDTLDHGMERLLPPNMAVAFGEFHTWVVCDGWLIDFAARTLPAKFDRAHRAMPFSTRRGKWRKFPKTIRHDLSKPMPDPLTDVRAAYGYHERGPVLLDEVTHRLLPLLRKADRRAMELAA